MRSRFYILVVIVSLLVPGFVRAQQGVSIYELREQVKNLELVDRDPNTSPDIKDLNRDFLKQRRIQLYSALQGRIDALRKYQSSVGASLTPEEIRKVEASIQSLEMDRHELERVMSGSTSNADSANKIAARQLSPETKLDITRVSTSSIATSDMVNTLVGLDSSSLLDTSDCTYPNVPAIISDDVANVAADIVEFDDPSQIGNLNQRIIFYTVGDALTQSEQIKVSALTAYVYIGETTRTDKQMGTTAASGGSTSAAEKPGWADILGFAVERGAIQQDVSDTTLTLSTTPYAFVVPSAGDTAEARRQYGYLRRLGLSASFNISNKDSALANATRKDLSQYSAKLGLTQPRGPNSKEFDDRWNTLIKPAIQEYLDTLSGGIETLFGSTRATGIQNFRTTLVSDLTTSITAYRTKANADRVTVDAQKAKIKGMILCALKSRVFDEVKTDGTGKINIDKDVSDKIVGSFIPALIDAQKGVDKTNLLYKQMMEDFEKRPEASLSFVHNRPTTGSEYSTVSFLYQQYLPNSPVKLTFNAGSSFYDRSNAVMNQTTFRDFITNLTFEGRSDGPFNTDDADLSQLTYSLTARYQYLRENKGVPKKKADIAVIQFRLDIPVSKGISIPLSLTYANATEQNNEQHVRGNFGLTFDVDKFLGIRRLLQLTKLQ